MAIHLIRYKKSTSFKIFIPTKIIICEEVRPIKRTKRYLLKDKRELELLNVKFLFNKKEQILPKE